MVPRHSLLGLAVLQQLLLLAVASLSTPSPTSAISFGNPNGFHDFLPALSPSQIPLEELWTQITDNYTLPNAQALEENKGTSNDKKESASAKDGVARIEETQYLHTLPPQPTTRAKPPSQELYDLSSAFDKRDGACGTQHTACSAQGFPGFCCTTVAACSRDYYGNIACCPYGAVCTGSVAAGAQQTSSPTTTTPYQQTATTTTAGSPTTAGAGFIQVSGFTVATVGSTTGAAVGLASMPWQLLMLSFGAIFVRMIML